MLFKIDNLKVQYEGAQIIKGISLKVYDGEIVCLIGSNGAGKTTTLRTISGLVRPHEGEIWFQNNRVEHMSPKDIVKMGIVHVPQGRSLFPYMSVLENLRIGAFLRKDKVGINKDLEELFEHFPVLKERRNQLALTLSGGESQMLAIACALMVKPKLLLLDEPSLGLSPLMVEEIGKIVLDINKKGTSILWVEQNAQLALNLTHRGYVMENGKIVLEDFAKNLLINSHVKKAYLGQ